jgi:3-deoxy-D-manno-octulosonic-acid transferase
LLEGIGMAAHSSISGDTRFDRVIEIAEGFRPVELIAEFIGTKKAIVAGSTWRGDEGILSKAFTSPESSLKLIIAPHEIAEAHLSSMRRVFPGSIFFSELQAGKTQPAGCNVLIIDNIGMLSRLYHYAFVAYVGGGFRKEGIHNVLEAAVYGKPVLYGPEHKKFSEAVALVEAGGGICVHDARECARIVQSLLDNAGEYAMRSESSRNYVWENRGATGRITRFIQEKRLLTI